MSSDNLPPPFKIAELTQKPHRRLKELERRVAGFGSLTNPVGVSSVEHFYSTQSNTAVASGSFPAAEATESVTPARDCGFVVAVLRVIAQLDASIPAGTFDYGCNIGVDTGAGFGFQWAVTFAERTYVDPVNNTSLMRMVMGSTAFGSPFVGDLCPPLVAGEPFVFRHEYYYPDIGGLGGFATFYSEFHLVGFPDII